MAETWNLGLKLGMAAFLAFILAPLLPFPLLPYVFLGVAAAAVLYGDARRRGDGAGRTAVLGLVLTAGGLLGLLATNNLAYTSLAAGQFDLWKSTIWLRLAVEVAVAAGFYMMVLHLAAERSRLLLNLAFGAAFAVVVLAAVASLGPADALVAQGQALGAEPGSEAYRAWAEAALVAFFQAIETPALAKGLPFVLYGWAYATILGRLRRSGGQPVGP